jgi:hypothetical protein
VGVADPEVHCCVQLSPNTSHYLTHIHTLHGCKSHTPLGAGLPINYNIAHSQNIKYRANINFAIQLFFAHTISCKWLHNVTQIRIPLLLPGTRICIRIKFNDIIIILCS